MMMCIFLIIANIHHIYSVVVHGSAAYSIYPIFLLLSPESAANIKVFFWSS